MLAELGTHIGRRYWLWLPISATYLLFAIFSYPDLASDIHDRWTTPGDLDFGYAVLLVFFALGCSANHHSQPLGRDFAGAAWFLLAANQVLTFVAVSASLQSVAQALLLINLPLIMWLVGGRGPANTAFRATAVLSMALPIWYLTIPILQSVTVWVCNLVLGNFGLQYYLQGNYFELPTGIVEVAEGCSGHKYFVSSLTIAFAYVAMSRLTLKSEVLVILFAGILAMVANWIRVGSLIVVASLKGVDHHLIKSHDLFGWVVFGVAMFILFLLIKRVERYDPDAAELPLADKPTKNWMATFAGFTLLLGLPLALNFVPRDVADVPDLTQMLDAGGTQTSSPATTVWGPTFVGYTKQQSRATSFKGQALSVHLTSYVEAKPGQELVSSSNHVLGNGSSVDAVKKYGAAQCAQLSSPVTATVLWWYDIDGFQTSSNVRAKTQEVISHLFARAGLASHWALFVPGKNQCELLLQARSEMQL